MTDYCLTLRFPYAIDPDAIDYQSCGEEYESSGLDAHLDMTFNFHIERCVDPSAIQGIVRDEPSLKSELRRTLSYFAQEARTASGKPISKKCQEAIGRLKDEDIIFGEARLVMNYEVAHRRMVNSREMDFGSSLAAGGLITFIPSFRKTLSLPWRSFGLICFGIGLVFWLDGFLANQWGQPSSLSPFFPTPLKQF